MRAASIDLRLIPDEALMQTLRALDANRSAQKSKAAKRPDDWEIWADDELVAGMELAAEVWRRGLTARYLAGEKSTP